MIPGAADTPVVFAPHPRQAKAPPRTYNNLPSEHLPARPPSLTYGVRPWLCGFVDRLLLRLRTFPPRFAADPHIVLDRGWLMFKIL
jgi:hypothetical protein